MANKRGSLHNPPTNAFQPGNQIWKLASENVGQPRKYSDAKSLWDAAVAYFVWIEEHPLLEQKVFHSEGNITKTDVAKMRAMTITGLCLHIGIGESTWHSWKDRNDARYREDLIDVMEMIHGVIREQKFTGAAGGLLNPVVIARDLGLSDKSEISGPDGGPIQTKEVSARDVVAGKLAGIAARSGASSDLGGADRQAG